MGCSISARRRPDAELTINQYALGFVVLKIDRHRVIAVMNGEMKINEYF